LSMTVPIITWSATKDYLSTLKGFVCEVFKLKYSFRGMFVVILDRTPFDGQ